MNKKIYDENYAERSLNNFKIYSIMENSINCLNEKTINVYICSFVDANVSLIIDIFKCNYKNNKVINNLQLNIKKYFKNYITNKDINVKRKIFALVIVMLPNLAKSICKNIHNG